MGRVGGWAAGVRRTGRDRPVRVDAVGAVVLSALGVASLTRPDHNVLLPAAVVLALLATSSVGWRNRAPLAAVAVTAAATAGYQWITRAKDFPAAEGLALLLLLYTAGARGVSRRHQAELIGLAVLTVGLCVAVVAASGPTKGSTLSTDVQPPLAALAAGYLVARQRSLSRHLTSAIAQLHAEEEVRASVSTAKERNRVARELHDVVTHGVSAMVVQAGAARITVDSEPEVAVAALSEVVAAGRSAIEALRRVVTALHPHGPEDGGPPVGLAGVRPLVDGWRAAGLPVQLAITGDEAVLPEPVDVACYRLVQEALTNVVKHAPGAETAVSVVIEAGALEVSICNEAVSHPSGLFPLRSGHGLIGMTERVESCSGQITYGHRPEGGFEVHARLPFAGNVGPGGDAMPTPPRLDGGACPFFERARAFGAWPGVALALAVLCGDAAVSSSLRGPLVLNLCLCAAMAVMLLWRRRSPLLFLVAVNVAAFPISNGLASIDKSTLVSTYVFAIPVWAVAAWSEVRIAAAGLVIAVGFEVAEVLHWHLGAGSVAGNATVCAALWAAGRVWRSQQRTATYLAGAQARVEAGQRARVEVVLAATRADMVGELDGLVVAQIAAMVTDAEGVQQAVKEGMGASSPIAIGQIEDDGRLALARLREILGLLRTEHDPGRLSPLLGVDQLYRLVGDCAGSGDPTNFAVTGEPVPLVGGVDLVAYRVIVDVLTHADCESVDLHFDAGGWLSLGFRVAAGSAALDAHVRVEVEQAHGFIERSLREIVVQIPLAVVLT